MTLRQLIDMRGKGAVQDLQDEISELEGRDIHRSTIHRWSKRCHVESCGDICWTDNGKIKSNINLTEEEAKLCR